MKFVLVAGDYAQSEVLMMLGAALEKTGHKVHIFLAFGKTPLFQSSDIKAWLVGADWLVAGMSEKSDEEVAAVKEAMEKNVKIALYADTFDAHKLPAFKFARKEKLILFVINEGEAEGARKLFPNADVIMTGNPTWEKFAYPALTREDARKKLGIAKNRRVILSIGDKFLAQNIIQFGATIDAVYAQWWEKSTDILLALHPGDPNSPDLYNELVEKAGCSVRIIGKHVGINTGEILPACDLVVEFTSTLGIQAACLRIPVIDYCSTIALRGRRPKVDKDPWVLAEYGASLPVYCGCNDGIAVASLAQAFEDVSEVIGKDEILMDQEEMFPIPPPGSGGQAIRKMCEALK